MGEGADARAGAADARMGEGADARAGAANALRRVPTEGKGNLRAPGASDDAFAGAPVGTRLSASAVPVKTNAPTGEDADAPRERMGSIVKLDRGFPLVRFDDGTEVRCEHATALVKGERVRAAIGDRVAVALPDEHDKGIICGIEPRRTAFVRKDPADRTAGQVLAANFNLVMVVEPIVQLNRKRLERELVLAHETGADVAVVLTKLDLLDPCEGERVVKEVADLAGRAVKVLATSMGDANSIARVRALVAPGSVAILIGKSGVGKSTLVNLLAGSAVQDTASVRERDGKGRHTTVDRVMVPVPGGGTIVDMPGVRGLGMWDADQGLGAAFHDVEEFAARCRFRDCSHGEEPGCAVRAAVEAGQLAEARVASYRSLAAEIAAVRAQRAEADHLRGEKASDRRRKRSHRG